MRPCYLHASIVLETPSLLAPFLTQHSRYRDEQADVTFPGGKKAKANPGDPLKAVAKKAGYKAAYGCEEGKCGTCEHKVKARHLEESSVRWIDVGLGDF